MKFLLSLLFTLFFLSIRTGAQVKRLRVALRSPSSSFEDISINSMVYLQNDTCLACYKGIPKKIKEAVVKTYAFDYTNLTYQMYKDKMLSDSVFNKLEKLYSFSKSDYWPSKVNSKMKVLYAVDSNNSPFYIFDTNNDSSFSKEKIYSKKELQNLTKIIIRNLEAVINGKKVKESALINIDFNGCDENFKDPFVQKWKLCGFVKHDKIGTLALKDFRRDFVVTNDIDYGFRYYSKGTLFYLLDPSARKGNTKVIPYKIGDTIYTQKDVIKIDSIDTNGRFIDFTIVPSKDKKQYGLNVGDLVKPAVYMNYFDSSSLNFEDYSGKFIFLDFWGSWCVPCKTVNPEVLRLKAELEKGQNKNSIVFLNVAWESNGLVGKYKEEVDKYYNGWNSLLEFQDQKIGMVKQLRIDGFPTFILVSPSRKILLRKTGSDQFKLFASQVKSMID